MAQVTLKYTVLDMEKLGWMLPTTGLIVNSNEAEDRTVITSANTPQDTLEYVLTEAGYLSDKPAPAPTPPANQSAMTQPASQPPGV